MKPTNFPDANSKLTAPEGMPGCLDLHVYRADGHVVSLWRATWRERLSLLVFGRVWLHFVGVRTHPPVSLHAERDVFGAGRFRKWIEKRRRRQALKAAGWQFGSVKEFLGLTDEEMKDIDARVAKEKADGA